MGSPGRIAPRNTYLCNSFTLSLLQRSLSLFSKTTTALPPPLEKAESGGPSKKRGKFYVRQRDQPGKRPNNFHDMYIITAIFLIISALSHKAADIFLSEGIFAGNMRAFRAKGLSL